MDSVFDFLTFLKSNSKKYYFSFLFLISTFFCFSQNLEIKQVSWVGTDVVVLYDLLDDNIDHRYTLNLYGSQDDFIKPLKCIDNLSLTTHGQQVDVSIDQRTSHVRILSVSLSPGTDLVELNSLPVIHPPDRGVSQGPTFLPPGLKYPLVGWILRPPRNLVREPRRNVG